MVKKFISHLLDARGVAVHSLIELIRPRKWTPNWRHFQNNIIIYYIVFCEILDP